MRISEFFVESIDEWVLFMEQGLLGGRSYSQDTVKQYRAYVQKFIQRHGEYTKEAIKKELLRVPAEQYGKRDKLFKALVCFGKYLVVEKGYAAKILEEIKPYKPKRNQSPKRLCPKDNEVMTIQASTQTVEEKLILLLLTSLGMRANEFCCLKIKDVNISEPSIFIEHGKGGKSRTLGIPSECIPMLTEWIQGKLPDDYLFVNGEGLRLTRHTLDYRLKKIANRCGLTISSHPFRRYFATSNIKKGRPLSLIQKALGHSSIATTQIYERLANEDLVDAMKEW